MIEWANQTTSNQKRDTNMSNNKTKQVVARVDTTSALAAIINSKLQVTFNELMVERNLRAKGQFDFDIGTEGFTIYLTHGAEKQTSQYFTIEFTADVSEKDLGRGEEIVELTAVKLVSIESDSYEWGTVELNIDDAEPLVEVAKEIINNANFYRLVDSGTYTTDDLNATYSELSIEYDKEYR